MSHFWAPRWKYLFHWPGETTCLYLVSGQLCSNWTWLDTVVSASPLPLWMNQTHTFCCAPLISLYVPSKPERLSGDNLSVSCPRLSPDGSTLIYLQGQVFGPHNQCLSLQQVVCVFGCLCMCTCVVLLLNSLTVGVHLPQLDLKSGETSALLDVVNRPQTGRLHTKMASSVARWMALHLSVDLSID